MKTAVTLILATLPCVTMATEPAFRDSLPLDFCLEAVSALNQGKSSFLSDRLDLRLAYDMSLNAMTLPPLQRTILGSESIRSTINKSMRMAFETTLANGKLTGVTGGWRLANVDEVWPEQSTCRMVFTKEGDFTRISGLQMQIHRHGNDFLITDFTSSYFNRPFSTLVRDTLRTMVSLTSDPAIGVQPASDKPWLEAYFFAVTHDQNDKIIQLYESSPYLANDINFGLLGTYLSALYAQKDGRRKYFAKMLDATAEAPSSVLASYLIEEHRKNEFSLMVDSFEKNYGYSPGLDRLRLLAYQSWGDKHEVFRRFATALSRDDRDDTLCWNMFTFLVKEHRYSEATTVMDAMKARFGYDFSTENLKKSNVFNDFILSKTYLDWISKQQHPLKGS